jgi:hypothetical protein
MTTRDIARLPLWARDEIAGLKTRIDQLERELARERNEHNGQHENTNLVLQGRIHYPDMNLPRDASIHYYMNGRDEKPAPYENGIEIRHSKNAPWTLEVNGFSGAVLVKPSAANALSLILEKRF